MICPKSHRWSAGSLDSRAPAVSPGVGGGVGVTLSAVTRKYRERVGTGRAWAGSGVETEA